MITLGITGRSGCGKSTVTAVFARPWCPAGGCRPDLPRDPAARFSAAASVGPAVRGRYPLCRRQPEPPPAGRPCLCCAGRKGRSGFPRASGDHPAGLQTEAGRPGSRSTAFCDRRSRDRGHRCGKRVRPPLRGHCALCHQCGPHCGPGRHRSGNGGTALNAQTPEEVLLARADLVLRNDADLASLEAAAAALCEQLQAEGARKGGADTSL